MQIKLPINISEAKNKYLFFGDKTPEDMFLPIVIDITSFEEMLNYVVKRLHPGRIAKIRYSEDDDNTITIHIEKEE